MASAVVGQQALSPDEATNLRLSLRGAERGPARAGLPRSPTVCDCVQPPAEGKPLSLLGCARGVSNKCDLGYKGS